MRPSYSCLKQQHSIQPPFSKDSRHGLSLGSGPQMAGWVSVFCKELNEGPATQKNSWDTTGFWVTSRKGTLYI